MKKLLNTAIALALVCSLGTTAHAKGNKKETKEIKDFKSIATLADDYPAFVQLIDDVSSKKSIVDIVEGFEGYDQMQVEESHDSPNAISVNYSFSYEDEKCPFRIERIYKQEDLPTDYRERQAKINELSQEFERECENQEERERVQFSIKVKTSVQQHPEIQRVFNVIKSYEVSITGENGKETQFSTPESTHFSKKGSSSQISQTGFLIYPTRNADGTPDPDSKEVIDLQKKLGIRSLNVSNKLSLLLNQHYYSRKIKKSLKHYLANVTAE
jgi:hypothetical protein